MKSEVWFFCHCPETCCQAIWRYWKFPWCLCVCVWGGYLYSTTDDLFRCLVYLHSLCLTVKSWNAPIHLYHVSNVDPDLWWPLPGPAKNCLLIIIEICVRTVSKRCSDAHYQSKAWLLIQCFLSSLHTTLDSVGLFDQRWE